ncbi:patatin-like phospholipase family protein [Vibrio rhodolitus]|uniref:patatin-like phospholipase family protein n=1 Tax=Vibrio rhodolitus TaxID=2231649 RepID=UPI000E0A6B46|nr:patatin-like phospholipase family protein [Vibrio rhodolitus]
MNNSGVVTNTAHSVDIDRLTKYTSGVNALVAQGGGQRGIFTAGVLDAFLLSDFDPFHRFYGTSAGALNLAAFLCRQKGIGRSFILDLTTSSEFFHLFSYIRSKQYLGLDWALDKICDYPYRLDVDMGRRVLGNNRQAFAAVTESSQLIDRYLPMLGPDWQKVLIASCAIPRLYEKEVEFSHGRYIDGGVSASIPVQEAWRQGARCIVVIRTEGDETPNSEPLVTQKSQVEWYRDSLNLVQEHWQQKLGQWKSDWNTFFSERIQRSKQDKQAKMLASLNGGRWLFGADDIYRLSHLIGDNVDSSLMDMLMVHYQTYSLTRDFLHSPPDDCYIVQIKPDQPLLSSSLMSDREELLHDYQLGLDAGLRCVEMFDQCNLTQVPLVSNFK